MGEFGISDIDILDPDSHPQRDRHMFPADDIHPRFPMVPPLFTGGCYQPPSPSTSGQILGEAVALGRAWMGWMGCLARGVQSAGGGGQALLHLLRHGAPERLRFKMSLVGSTKTH